MSSLSGGVVDTEVCPVHTDEWSDRGDDGLSHVGDSLGWCQHGGDMAGELLFAYKDILAVSFEDVSRKSGTQGARDCGRLL